MAPTKYATALPVGLQKRHLVPETTLHEKMCPNHHGTTDSSAPIQMIPHMVSICCRALVCFLRNASHHRVVHYGIAHIRMRFTAWYFKPAGIQQFPNYNYAPGFVNFRKLEGILEENPGPAM